MSAEKIGFAVVLLGVVLLLAKIVRLRWGLMQSLFLPSSIIGGFACLALGPYIFGRIAEAMGNDQWAEFGLFGPDIIEVWSALPGLLISVVFATLFLGQPIPSPKRAAKLVGPQLSLGVIFGSGQYVLGLLLAVLILVPLFNISPMAGTLIEIGFEGGHGTAAGMRGSMEELGFADGGDLALGMATVGVVGGVLIGVAAINWAVRTGRTEVLHGNVEQSIEEQKGLFRKDEQYPAAMMTVRPASIEPMSMHFALVALAILIGWAILQGLQWVEDQLWGADDAVFGNVIELFEYVPLFPLALLGGVLIQFFMDKTGREEYIDEGMMLRIQGLALDFLIISALATLSLAAIARNWEPFVILALAGTAFNVFVLLYLAPKIIPQFWFERGIGDFGQSMGVTATGLILMRIADPEAESPALEAFAYKQLLFEPFFGGGFITAAAIPLVAQFGPYPLLIAMSVLFVLSLAAGLLYFGKQDWKGLERETKSGSVAQ